ncbi:hypothetical protein FCIRC_12463, partial [Fusarium circinatum]
RLPSGRQNLGHLPSGSVSMVTPLPTNVRGGTDVVMKGTEPSERPSHGHTVDSKDDDGNVGALTRESEFDEFPDSDLDGLLEADIEQLVGPALLRAPIAEADEPETRENEFIRASDPASGSFGSAVFASITPRTTHWDSSCHR